MVDFVHHSSSARHESGAERAGQLTRDTRIALFEGMFDQAFNAIVVTDARPGPDGPAIILANDAFCRMTGYEADELIGRTPRILQGPDTSGKVLDELAICLREERYFRGSTVNYRKDGRPYVVEWNISPVRDDQGNVTHFISIQQDISDLVSALRTNQLLADALNSTQDGVMITDHKECVVHVNQGFEHLTGYSGGEIIGKTPAVLKSGEMDASFYRELRQTLERKESFKGMFLNRHKDGREIYLEETITPLLDPAHNVTHYVSVIKDLSDRVAQEKTLRHEAEYDELTGALTRKAGEKRLQHAKLLTAHGEQTFSVIMADIDHFKAFNDQLGHAMGDRVLRDVGQVFCETVRSTDSAVRWGGEEFLMILPYTTLKDAQFTAQRCRETVSRLDAGEARRVTASFGVAELASDESAEDAVRRADLALYRAKSDGRNRVCSA